MKVRIKPGMVDEELALRSMQLNFGGVEVETPYKTTTAKSPYGQVNEAFARYSWAGLNNILTNTAVEKRGNAGLKAKKADGINIVISEYKDGIIPNGNMIRAMAQIQYAHTDIVTTPLWPGVIGVLMGDGEYLTEKLVALNDAFIDEIESRNGKSIWGVVPQRLPRLYIRDYVRSLIDRGVTSFIVDFNNAAIDSNPSWLLELLDAVKEYKLLDESIFYAVNANEGRFSKKAEVIPAKDFLCCGFDFDLLGQNNTPVRGNDEFFKRLKNNPGGEALTVYRDFDRSMYGYRRRESTSPEVRETAKRVNVRRQVEESTLLRGHLKEESSVESYILTKRGIPEKLLKESRRLRAEIYGRERARQTTLI